VDAALLAGNRDVLAQDEKERSRRRSADIAMRETQP
jgi:hypothetical protein